MFLARKHEVLRQVTKLLNDRVLFEETEMPFRAFRFWKTKISSVYFIFVLVSIFNNYSWTNTFSFQLELLTFILKSFVHCVRYAQEHIIMLILNKLLSWNLALNL